MTLLDFLNEVRSRGGDITKMAVRNIDTPPKGENWGTGFKIRSLRGNRLRIVTSFDPDYPLMPGHSILKGTVWVVRRSPVARRLSPPTCESAAIIVEVSHHPLSWTS